MDVNIIVHIYLHLSLWVTCKPIATKVEGKTHLVTNFCFNLFESTFREYTATVPQEAKPLKKDVRSLLKNPVRLKHVPAVPN